MADNETYQNYLASLTVFDKVSEKNVKQLLTLVDGKSPKTASEAEAEVIKGTETLNRTNTNPKNLSDVSKESMIINGKVAVKAISPEEKKITKSNYEIAKAKVEEYFEKEPLKDNLLKDLKKNVTVIKNGFKIKDYIEDIQDNLDAYNEMSKAATVSFTQDPANWFSQMVNYLTGPVYNKKGDILLRTDDEETRNFLAKGFIDEQAFDLAQLIENGDGFRKNYTIYRQGITKDVKPIKPLQIENVNKVMKAYLKKLRGMEPGKLPVEGGKVNNYGGTEAKGDTIKSYYDTHMNALLQQVAERKSKFSKIDFPASLEGTLKSPVPKYLHQQKHTIQGGKKGIKLADELNNTESRTNKNLSRSYNNPFIKDMLAAGPDLFSNMFDIYLRFNRSPSHSIIKRDTKEDDARISNSSKALDANDYTSYVYFLPPLQSKGTKGSFANKASKPYVSMVNDVYSFSVRNTSVTIPMANRETSVLKFLNTEVERTTSQVTMNLEGTLSLDMDANTYIADMFSALSGLQREGKYNDGGNMTSRMDSFFNRTSGHYPFLAPAKLGWELSSVDLIVSSHSLNGWYSNYTSPNGNGNVNNLLFVFKDVRFLGAGNDIKFNSESSSSQTCDVSFIAKEVMSYYKPDNTLFESDTDVVKRDMNFNSKNVKGTTYDESSFIPTEADDAVTKAANGG